MDDDAAYVSTGRLPSAALVAEALDEAYEKFRHEDGGAPSTLYPALARVPGTCSACARPASAAGSTRPATPITGSR